MPVTKEKYAGELKNYIAHKRQLSKLNGYNTNAKFMTSISKVWDLYKAVKGDCGNYNLKRLFDLVKINEGYLRNILPVVNNPSYESSVKKVEEIILIAKTQI